MKKFLFCPLCLIMGSCLPDGDTSSDKTLQLSKICEELDKYYPPLTKDQKSQNAVSLKNISSVLLAFKKIYDAEKDNLNDTENFQGWHKKIIDALTGNRDFNQNIKDLLKEYKNDLKGDAVEMFLDIYGELCNRLKEKNIFTTITADTIQKQDDKAVIEITKQDIDNFEKDKKGKSTQQRRGDKTEENSNIYVSDLVNYYFKNKNLALLKNKKYLVVELKEKGDVLLENKDKTEVFEYSLQGGTVMKFVCSIDSNCNYFETFNAFDQNIPKFLNTNEDGINQHGQCKESRVVCIFSLEKVSDAKLESLQEDE